jgi:glycosyltransferase involved in cell wall biosynthesis
MPGPADPSGCRVALVLGSSHGGMGAHVRMLAAGLAERGAQVAVLGPQAAARGADMARETRVSFRTVEIGDRPRLRDAATLARLRRSLAGADVVHAHGIRAGALCALALGSPGARGAAARRGSGRRRRPALVVTVHNPPPLAGGVPGLAYRALEIVVARGAGAVLCVSGDLEARMRAAGARRVSRAVVPAPPARGGQRAGGLPARDGAAPDWAPPDGAAPDWAAPDWAAPDGAAPDWAGGERPIVLGAGRLVPQKGFGILLEAAASWLDMDPRPLVVIAGAGPLAGSLRDQAAALGVDALFLGHRDDVPGLLAAADVIAIPSLWEGQPLVLQEALRAGAPIVAARVGGIPGLTRGTRPAGGAGGPGAGETAAVLVTPGDWRELAAAVRAVLTDQALAARLRAAARRRAADLPSPDEAITAVLAAYADTIGDT